MNTSVATHYEEQLLVQRAASLESSYALTEKTTEQSEAENLIECTCGRCGLCEATEMRAAMNRYYRIASRVSSRLRRLI
ncbi:hypothetical protein ACPXCP_41130 [Streptomyces sp. DT20]|uniref:hypothetical protein n=1 Tax=Streptomyces sp. DT20 TaxID=3416519 RepID=UPI003CEC3511